MAFGNRSSASSLYQSSNTTCAGRSDRTNFTMSRACGETSEQPRLTLWPTGPQYPGLRVPNMGARAASVSTGLRQ